MHSEVLTFGAVSDTSIMFLEHVPASGPVAIVHACFWLHVDGLGIQLDRTGVVTLFVAPASTANI